MSTSIKTVVQGIRSLILYPPYGLVPNHLILERLQDRLTYYLTALNITNENWFLTRYSLTVTPNTDEFPLDVAGRPVLCVTVDSSDPFHVEREIELTSIQDRDLYYIGPKQGMTSGVEPHAATSFSIFYDQDQGQRIIKVTPQHTMTAQYVLWLEPETFAPPRLADNFPIMENFLALVKTDTAMSLLPALVDGGNEAKVSAMQIQLGQDMQRYAQQFEIYKLMAKNEQLGPRRGWATDSHDVFGW